MPRMAGRAFRIFSHSVRLLDASPEWALNGALRLLQIERVLREHLLGADPARENLLVAGELDHGVHRLTVAREPVRERIVSDDGAALGQRARVARQLGARAQLLEEDRLGVLERLE